MRFGFAAGILLTAGLVFAGSSAARADNDCVSPKGAVEKMNGNYGTVEQLSQLGVEGLAKAFAEANGGKKMAKADTALVFHRPDNPIVACVILFMDGCAVGESPMMEETVRKGIAQAAPGASPQAAPDSKSGAK
jgi:hypothetical protein